MFDIQPSATLCNLTYINTSQINRVIQAADRCVGSVIAPDVLEWIIFAYVRAVRGHTTASKHANNSSSGQSAVSFIRGGMGGRQRLTPGDGFRTNHWYSLDVDG